MLPISEIMMSVIPHLSRIAEKIMVRNWLLHFIRAHTLLDQFAFKPTGSTTAVLVHFTRHIIRLLEYNQYVRCLMIDFSKAFDTVDHVILLSKLVKFDLPGFVINWICSFF